MKKTPILQLLGLILLSLPLVYLGLRVKNSFQELRKLQLLERTLEQQHPKQLIALPIDKLRQPLSNPVRRWGELRLSLGEKLINQAAFIEYERALNEWFDIYQNNAELAKNDSKSFLHLTDEYSNLISESSAWEDTVVQQLRNYQKVMLIYFIFLFVLSVLIILIGWVKASRQKDPYELIQPVITALKEANYELGSQLLESLLAKAEHSKLTETLSDFSLLVDRIITQRETLSFLAVDSQKGGPGSSSISLLAQEMRSPLNAVTHSITDLYELKSVDPSVRETVEQLYHNAIHLVALLNTAVDFNKEQDGQLNLNPSVHQLIATFESIQYLFSKRFTSRDVTFKVQYDQAQLNEYYQIDLLRLAQLLIILLNQAWLKTEKGQVELKVQRISKRAQTHDLLFEINDTGDGYSEIEMDQLNTIHPSRQINPKTKSSLMLAKQILALMGSKLEIISEEGLGACYRFELKLPVQTKSDYDEFSKGSLKDIAEQISPAKMRILLVDDNEVNLKISTKILQREGYHTQMATNGYEALDLLEDTHFDLVLMDLQMPGMSGIECTRKLRTSSIKLAKTLPIIALTASDDEQSRNEAFSAGMNDYLTKPYTPLDLLHGVARNLELAHRFGHSAVNH